MLAFFLSVENGGKRKIVQRELKKIYKSGREESKAMQLAPNIIYESAENSRDSLQTWAKAISGLVKSNRVSDPYRKICTGAFL